MARPSDRERRQHVRFPQSLEVHGRSLRPIHAADSDAGEFVGRIQNISEGGITLLTELPLEPSSFVRCNIIAPDVPVAIPSLMQIRWSVVRRDHGTQSYLSGLQFVA